jgi:hypothetical protein
MNRFTRHLGLQLLKLAVCLCVIGLFMYLFLPPQITTTLQKVRSLPYLDLSPYAPFVQALAPNLVSAIIIFLFGYSWHTLATLLGSYRARFFWGQALPGVDLVICHGTMMDSRLQNPGTNPFRFVKKTRDGRTIELAGPGEYLLGDSEVRSVSSLVNALSKYRRQPV